MRNLSFEVRPGVVTGFLGPNGAGKSTTMRLMLRLVRGSGSTTFGGRQIHQLRHPSRTVGAMLDPTAHHPGRTAWAHIHMLAAAAGASNRRVDEVIDLVGLSDVARQRSGEFSLGMQQRLALAAALVGDPEYLILDEPANGLDPQGIRWLRDFLTSLTAQGRTVLLSSHQLAEMAQTADEVIVLGRGQIITQGRLGDFVERFTHRYVVMRSPHLQHLAECLRANHIGPVEPHGPDGLVVTGRAGLEELGELAAHYGITLHELSSHTSSLEDAFLEATAADSVFTAGAGRSHPEIP
ncbi:ATP-binding cassette domain-containing protein [Kineosporia sp. NBRC 101731]|uniref:ABC transporter ATP-binding protein n=1 Tax=Kineosporia sp. NBRC 101731 TaxID=3032199 RepID=UPI0024A43FBB|nr:ATP-binding cassette domain-containing protein [Kineosporia sp. NBRC 101731]GLY31858.1 putative ABC transporter, ATP-binding protein [Kineosporia sp. NBRC 101731]